ncbi:hypothetical protein [Alcanivorax sp.]|uniref:hypothetical protein n=1 Tax=Alcanivorax sp. TaxID=1872427 RepID=UPI003BABE7B0
MPPGRRQGDGGQGGDGGGLLLIRAAGLQGGALDLRGLPGSPAGEVGGGGGSGGTLWLDLTVIDALGVTIEHAGGTGAKDGGRGGDGQRLASGQRDWPGFHSLRLAGAEAGFRCRPAGHWLTGVLFEDNGAGGGQAFNLRREGDESPLARSHGDPSGPGQRLAKNHPYRCVRGFSSSVCRKRKAVARRYGCRWCCPRDGDCRRCRYSMGIQANCVASRFAGRCGRSPIVTPAR